MTLQKWDHKKQRLEKPPSYKIKRFVKLGCIVKQKEGEWICKPVPGYNTRTYTMVKDLSGWRCNCQGYNKRGSCSHIDELMIVKPNDKYELF